MRKACLSISLAFGAALAASGAYGASDLPPPIDAQPQQAAPAAQPAAAAPVPALDAAEDTPPAASAKPEASRDVQIEQKHVGRRVSEVIVTPAGFNYHYSMTRLDDQDPGTLMQPHPQLSVPNFVRFDFNF